MDVQDIPRRVHPESFSFARNRDFLDSLHAHEFAVLHGRHPFSQMEMNMALRLKLGRVVSDGPVITEQRFGLLHCRAKKLAAKLRRQLIERASMRARKREPAVRLGRVDVSQKEDARICRLLFCLAAKTTSPGFECLRASMIASAGNNIG